jgi:5-methyltetrahydropteroyltriglutamate--homocysteine methyltransferase
MRRSTERILTTHTGSLARPPELLAMLQARASAQPVDDLVFAEQTRAAVARIVREQSDAGIDVVSDGELSKPQFADYVADRLNGFEGHNPNPGFVRPSQRPDPFPEFSAWRNEHSPAPAISSRPMCIGPLSWKDRAYKRDIENLTRAIAEVRVEEAFMPSPSPGNISMRIPNEYYPSQDAFLFDLADVLAEEYRAITEAGLIPQIDAPDVAMAWDRQDWESTAEFRKAVALRIEALNHALAGIPEEQVRFHVCWGTAKRRIPATCLWARSSISCCR